MRLALDRGQVKAQERPSARLQIDSVDMRQSGEMKHVASRVGC
jgi:hypothetical protein